MVVASHWHDDHVRGLSTLFKIAHKALFVCSPALTSKDFLALSDLYANAESTIQNGPTEIQACLDEIVRRMNAGEANPIRYAHPDRTLLELRTTRAKEATKLLALSPSDEMVRRTHQYAAQLLTALEKGIREASLVPSAPNDTAVALRLDIGGRSILLGSDLEEHSNPSVGWSAVLQGMATAHIPAQTFKVAHHGSHTGHHPGVWTTMLSPNPLSLLTPFRLGRHQIPNDSDRIRILGLTEKAYISADPHATAKPTSSIPRKAAALVDSTASNRRLAIPSVGHIRWRAPLADAAAPGVVELFDGAMLLADVAAKPEPVETVPIRSRKKRP